MSEPEPQGKKTNIIVTYEELKGINDGVQKLNGKVDHLSAEMQRIGREHDDHEVRIRALELTQARQAGGTGLAQWATPLVISLGMFALGVLNYIK